MDRHESQKKTEPLELGFLGKECLVRPTLLFIFAYYYSARYYYYFLGHDQYSNRTLRKS